MSFGALPFAVAPFGAAPAGSATANGATLTATVALLAGAATGANEGQTMTVITWPSDLRPTRQDFTLESNTLLVTSPFSYANQAVSRVANRWVIELGFDPMDRARAGRVRALAAALDGGLNEVRLWNFLQPTPRGSAAVWPGGTVLTTWGEGTTWGESTVWGGAAPPVVPQLRAAALAGAELLPTWGWAANGAPLLEGDFLGLNGSLYMVTADAATDVAGRADLAIRPRLRADAALGDLITTTTPTARFRLVDGQQGRASTRGGSLFSSATLRFVESLP